MPVDQFKSRLKITQPFEAQGTIGKDYNVATMYVGIVQLAPDPDNPGKRKIAAGAYGMGPAATKRLRNNKDQDEWSMQLQDDSDDDKRKLEPGTAIGFVLAQLPGGKLTGWIHEEIKLE